MPTTPESGAQVHSGKRVLLTILGFMFGIIALLYALKLLFGL